MPRIARVVAVNYPHHITQRGNNRAAVFFDEKDRESYLHILVHYCKKYSIEIWAYCLMKNHVHLLAVPRKEESLARGIGGTSLVYTQYVNAKYGRSGRLWQNRFYSCVVEKDRYLWAVARYIDRNPLRAGIVKSAEEYKWSSAKSHILGKKNPVLKHPDWLGESDRVTYREFIRNADDEETELIRRATSTGRPLGKEGFVRMLEETFDRALIPKSPGRPGRKA